MIIISRMNIDIDMIGLVTENLTESLRFYSTLGLSVPEPAEGEDYVETKLPSGVRLSWNTIELIKQVDPEWVKPVGQGMGIAFLCDGPADVDQTYQRITGAGYKGRKAPWDAFWGQRYAIVEDPDGNAIDLFAPLG
jgi:catechol 2,3-dioxygenase-like lactoylglutathione lyase family enzyme